MALMRMARPQVPTSSDIRPLSAGEVNGRPLDELSTSPASPLYRSKVPPPPCLKCGEDHVPNRTYGHEYVREPAPQPQEQSLPQAAYVHTASPPALPETVTSRRVAVYIGRNDTFVVAVETSPDWDIVESFKVDETKVVDLIALARALGVKVADKTGGDLASLAMHAS